MPDIAQPILANDPDRRSRIVPVLQAALEAVDPAVAVRRALRREGMILRAGDRAHDLRQFDRVFLLGFGKAAVPMAEAAAALLGEQLAAGALVTKYGHGAARAGLPETVMVMEAGHPVPDAAGVGAARHIAGVARLTTADDLVLCLISGGGSALLPLPAGDLSLADLQATTAALLRCGATIDETNAVRKHLSEVQGGQLARLVAPATLVSLVLSDVVGSPLDVIASGPTVADRSTWGDASAVVEKYGLGGGVDGPALPAAVLERLRDGLRGRLPETPKAGDPAFARSQTLVIADNAVAAVAAAAAATAEGFKAAVLSTFVEGEAREVARVLVALGREVAARGRPVAAPACLILGGETTVTLRGPGKGGRNQELALAAALVLDQVPEGPRLVVAALATDGTDGPTDAAGGLVDAATVGRGRKMGLEAAGYLAANDAYPFLEATGDLFRTGPTQTNVNDLLFVFVF